MDMAGVAGFPNAMEAMLAREGRGVNGADEGSVFGRDNPQNPSVRRAGFPPSWSQPRGGWWGASPNPLILHGFLQGVALRGERRIIHIRAARCGSRGSEVPCSMFIKPKKGDAK